MTCSDFRRNQISSGQYSDPPVPNIRVQNNLNLKYLVGVDANRFVPGHAVLPEVQVDGVHLLAVGIVVNLKWK